MLFNSLDFLLFFPIVVCLYFAIPYRIRYIWLLISSYYFYMCWNPQYALLMATSTLITYYSGVLISKSNRLTDRKKRDAQKKLWVAVSFALNLSILYFFKYFDFSVSNINLILKGLHLSILEPRFDILLPVGISFYTFQALSYTMDVYRQEIDAERNFAKYALFVSFFPQLVAGPIERSKTLLRQISEKHSFDYNRIRNGLIVMLWGFFLKLVIADRAALLVNQVYNSYSNYSGLALAVATVCFALQIYCDFASYSIIAIGSAKVMGFSLMENFNTPYFSRSIGEFWRRWHISLSTWFRDYLYIPLGGNRKGKVRKHLNIMIVFLVSGFWHGASWTFVIWGGINGLYQVIGEVTKPARDKATQLLHINRNSIAHKLFQTVLCFILVCITWVFFRATSTTEALEILNRIINNFNGILLFDGELVKLGLDIQDMTILIISILVLIGVSVCKYNHIGLLALLTKQNLWFRWTVYLVLIFSVLVFGIYGPNYSESEFIYFQF